MSWHEYRGKHDPAEFTVPPELEKGRSMKIQAWIQSHHYRLLNEIARTGHFPFSERTDVIRWCIMFGLQYLDTLEPGTTRSIMSQANIINRRLQQQIHDATFIKTLTNLRQVVQDAKGRGDEDAAREEIQQACYDISRMPEEPDRTLRWKLKYIDAMRTEFRDYLPDGWTGSAQ